MSKAEGFHIPDAQNAATIGDTIKEAATMRPQDVVRRKLADISNLPQNQRLVIQEDKSKSIEENTTEYINKLQKENMALVKLLTQRNKIIELRGIELDRLRVNLLKMQEQNQQLALSNTQMLAELNSGKDRFKLLHHELGCKTGLLKARKIKLEGATTEPCKSADVELIKSQEEGKLLKEGINDEKLHKTKRNFESNGLSSSEHDQSKDKAENKRQSLRRQSARFKPAEDLFETVNTEVSVTQLTDDKKQTENKRPYVRRQSAKFKTVEVKPAENTTETNGTKIYESLLPEDTVQEQGSTSGSALVKDNDNGPYVRRQSAKFKTVEVKPVEDMTETNDTKIYESLLPEDTVQEQGSTSGGALVKDDNNLASSVPNCESEFGRPLLSRPSRVAAKKVKSYKEVPLNVKMRR